VRPIALPAAPDPDPFSDPLSAAVMIEMGERGYPAIGIDDVARRAGVTVAEFRRRFRDLDHCALDTYERALAYFERLVGGAYNARPDWRSGLRAAANEAADLLEEQPYLARFGNTEILRMRDEMARVRREELFIFCAEMIDQGREESPDPQAVPKAASVLAVGSIIQLLTHRLQEGAPISFQDAARESIYGIVRTYLGVEAAEEELAVSRSTSVLATR